MCFEISQEVSVAARNEDIRIVVGDEVVDVPFPLFSSGYESIEEWIEEVFEYDFADIPLSEETRNKIYEELELSCCYFFED